MILFLIIFFIFSKKDSPQISKGFEIQPLRMPRTCCTEDIICEMKSHPHEIGFRKNIRNDN